MKIYYPHPALSGSVDSVICNRENIGLRVTKIQLLPLQMICRVVSARYVTRSASVPEAIKQSALSQPLPVRIVLHLEWIAKSQRRLFFFFFWNSDSLLQLLLSQNLDLSRVYT